MADQTPSIVTLSGVIDIRSVSEAFAQVRQAAGTGGDVAVDLAEVTDADLTFVQLIESARRSLAQSGRALHLCAAAPDRLLETLQRGGFLAAPADDRFWRGLTGASR